ncbi:MAG: hypothetical protein D6730_01815 [Bacteroidetes bacterium]|nr:MAG: hypothetical protein D6730_01815 [Bacteroidota bacterium]
MKRFATKSGAAFAKSQAYQDGNLELQEQGPGSIHAERLSPLVFLFPSPKKFGVRAAVPLLHTAQ